MSARARVLATATAFACVGCELAEVTVTEPQREVVAEAYVHLGIKQIFGLPAGDPQAPYNVIAVLLHRTLDAAGAAGPVTDARITVTRGSDGLVVNVPRSAVVDACASSNPPDVVGACYVTPKDQPGLEKLAPGDRLRLRIELPEGGLLTSETVVPGRFELEKVTDGGTCAVAPRAGTGLVWSRSEGAWAYVADTYITGLSRVFDVDDIDPLYLFGLAISAQDTTIVFPREFGVFARGDLDHAVSIALQAGLPDSTAALVSVTAVDRNWVNWARGGNFNPSGQVRVPSVQGDGTGVFGSSVQRAFRVLATSQASSFPPCPPDVSASSSG